MLDVPNIGNALAVGPLEVVSHRTDDFHHDEGTLPRSGELVHFLGVLDAT
jgi:hypothetical protein